MNSKYRRFHFTPVRGSSITLGASFTPARRLKPVIGLYREVIVQYISAQPGFHKRFRYRLLPITKSFFEKTALNRINFREAGLNFIDIFPSNA
jgi:hypothetical protein